MLKRLHSKGVSGEHKCYFTQESKKRKHSLNFDINIDIIFQSKSPDIGKTTVVYMWVVLKARWTISSTLLNQQWKTEGTRLSWQDNPQRVKDLVLKSVDLTHGLTVLVSWHVVTGFVQEITAQVVQVVDTD